MNIQQLLEKGEDIILNDFPPEWLDSFRKSLFGCTLSIDDNRRTIVPYRDFVRWYVENHEQINRHEKIKEILK